MGAGRVHCSRCCEPRRGYYTKRTHDMGASHVSICVRDEGEVYKNSCGTPFPSPGRSREGTV